MAYIAAVRQWSAQAGGNCCVFMQRARGICLYVKIIKSSAPGLKNGFNAFCRIACYAIFRRCFAMTKETFIQTMELLQKQPNYESDLARELLNTLKRAFPDTYD